MSSNLLNTHKMSQEINWLDDLEDETLECIKHWKKVEQHWISCKDIRKYIADFRSQLEYVNKLQDLREKFVCLSDKLEELEDRRLVDAFGYDDWELEAPALHSQKVEIEQQLFKHWNELQRLRVENPRLKTECPSLY